MQIDKKRENDKQNIESTRGYIYENPDSDIYETNNEYKIYFDIPGVEKDDINLKVEKNILTLTAECTKKPGEKYECLRHEMNYAGYKRSYELGNTIDAEKIKADFNNGTLVLTLQKREEQKTKEIKIKVN